MQMKQTNVKTIAFDGDLYARVAEKYYRDGNYVAALKYSHKQLEYADDNWLKAEAYARICDLYESMGLHAQAVAYLFEYLDICDEEELPDLYESLAVNFLNMGKIRCHKNTNTYCCDTTKCKQNVSQQQHFLFHNRTPPRTSYYTSFF